MYGKLPALYNWINKSDSTRRRFLQRSATLAATVAWLTACGTSSEQQVSLKGTKIGTSYSKREIDWLGLDHNKTFPLLLSMGFDLVRLPTYWADVEGQRGKYDFTNIKSMLDQSERSNQAVVLSVGLKAHRSPEFYPPGWTPALTDPVFLQQCARNCFNL